MIAYIFNSKPIKLLTLFIFDAFIVALSFYVSLLLRFDGHVPVRFLNNLLEMIFPALIFSIIAFYLSGLYRRLWRYTSIDDLVAIFYAVSISMTGTFLFSYFVTGRLPLSSYIIAYATILFFIGGSRLAIRLIYIYIDRPSGSEEIINTVIIGAGEAGSLVARELKKHGPSLGVKAIGYIDDDPAKQKQIIQGLPVLGTTAVLPHLAVEKKIREAIIAMPSAPYSALQNIIRICRDLKIQIKTVPGIYEILNGRVSFKTLKDVDIEDLLKRKPVKLDLPAVAAYLSGLTVLVTGAGGSIGSELCRQIATINPEKVIMLDHDENAIFFIYNELNEKYPQVTFHPVICDIKERQALEKVFTEHQPKVIFHTAAHKHVPLMELNPDEAVRNNIEGSKNVIDLASLYGVQKFVGISTDKAVNPSSVMGATKRVVEIYLQQKARTCKSCIYCSVRFGNVLGSQGSVVPLFRRQIAAGGPVRVTHPEITRYFMTIPEAVQLVIQAGALGKGGEIFVLDMGEPIKINDLARDMISLSGLVPDRDVKIIHTGLRPGEKLYEELFNEKENFAKTRHERIFIAPDTERSAEEIEAELAALAELFNLDGKLTDLLRINQAEKEGYKK